MNATEAPTGVQGALLFLGEVREDPDLRAEVRRRRTTLDVPALKALAAARGWQFGEDELRVAFRLDWEMRLVHAHALEVRNPPRA